MFADWQLFWHQHNLRPAVSDFDFELSFIEGNYHLFIDEVMMFTRPLAVDAIKKINSFLSDRWNK